MIKTVAFVHPYFGGAIKELQMCCEEIIAAGLGSSGPEVVDFSHFIYQYPGHDLDVWIIITSEFASEDDRLACLAQVRRDLGELFYEFDSQIRFAVEMPAPSQYKEASLV